MALAPPVTCHEHESFQKTWAHGVVGLSRSLSMREVSGSIPDVSNLPFFFGPAPVRSWIVKLPLLP